MIKKIISIVTLLFVIQIAFSGISFAKYEKRNVGDKLFIKSSFENIDQFNGINFIKNRNSDSEFFTFNFFLNNGTPSEADAELTIDGNTYILKNVTPRSVAFARFVGKKIIYGAAFSVSSDVAEALTDAQKVAVKIYMSGNPAFVTFAVPAEILAEWCKVIGE